MSAGPPKVPRNPYVATGLNFSDIAKSPGVRAMVEQSIASDVDERDKLWPKDEHCSWLLQVVP